MSSVDTFEMVCHKNLHIFYCADTTCDLCPFPEVVGTAPLRSVRLEREEDSGFLDFWRERPHANTSLLSNPWQQDHRILN
mmetsp:Transcript_35358/g.105635  ORF Transcript_35358/g.105635 Transcript_35358/m.105635 type:complete len:80 (+) Transcript_35358:153-392(+)